MNEINPTSSSSDATPFESPEIEPGSRRIIICCDGTSNEPGVTTTNVLRVSRGIAPVDSSGTTQIIYYDRGVGTAGKLDAITGGAFGYGLAKNVEDAYRFLVANYRSGDQIYLFGFSRGAFTARSIAGVIRQCGILRKEHAFRISEGYKLYRDPETHPDDSVSTAFRKKYAQQMPLIEFIGVWDTVGALGVPANRFAEAVKYWTWNKWRSGKPVAPPKSGRRLLSLPRGKHAFHDVTLSGIVKHACHALAIDERRPVFTPSVWSSKPKSYKLPDGEIRDQVVKQAWFPGVHTDVGGGSSNVQNSSISLNWIARAAEGTGLQFENNFWNGLTGDLEKIGSINSSPPGLWRLAGAQQRDMSGSNGGTECIHPSAKARREAKANYDPENLKNSPLPEC